MVHILKTDSTPVTAFNHISSHVYEMEITLLYLGINLNEEANIYEKLSSEI
jgi:hypothetical protein